MSAGEIKLALKAVDKDVRTLFLHLQSQLDYTVTMRQAISDASLADRIRLEVAQQVAETGGKILESLTKERDILERERKVVVDNMASMREERRNLENLMDELKKYGINVLRTKR